MDTLPSLRSYYSACLASNSIEPAIFRTRWKQDNHYITDTIWVSNPRQSHWSRCVLLNCSYFLFCMKLLSENLIIPETCAKTRETWWSVRAGTGIKPIGPIAPNWSPALEISTLGCSSTQNKWPVLQRTTLGPHLLRPTLRTSQQLMIVFGNEKSLYPHLSNLTGNSNPVY